MYFTPKNEGNFVAIYVLDEAAPIRRCVRAVNAYVQYKREGRNFLRRVYARARGIRP